MRYTLDDVPVNATTHWVSLGVRALVVLLGIALIAGATPYSFGQVFGVVAGIILIRGARTIVLTFTD